MEVSDLPLGRVLRRVWLRGWPWQVSSPEAGVTARSSEPEDMGLSPDRCSRAGGARPTAARLKKTPSKPYIWGVICYTEKESPCRRGLNFRQIVRVGGVLDSCG